MGRLRRCLLVALLRSPWGSLRRALEEFTAGAQLGRCYSPPGGGIAGIQGFPHPPEPDVER